MAFRPRNLFEIGDFSIADFSIKKSTQDIIYN